MFFIIATGLAVSHSARKKLDLSFFFCHHFAISAVHRVLLIEHAETRGISVEMS